MLSNETVNPNIVFIIFTLYPEPYGQCERAGRNAINLAGVRVAWRQTPVKKLANNKAGGPCQTG